MPAKRQHFVNHSMQHNHLLQQHSTLNSSNKPSHLGQQQIKALGTTASNQHMLCSSVKPRYKQYVVRATRDTPNSVSKLQCFQDLHEHMWCSPLALCDTKGQVALTNYNTHEHVQLRLHAHRLLRSLPSAQPCSRRIMAAAWPGHANSGREALRAASNPAAGWLAP
jgi:hypothetical protein